MKQITYFLFLLSLLGNTQAQGTWTQKADFAAEYARPYMVGFCVGSKCYAGLGGGLAWGEPQYDDFWEWDSGADAWIQKSNFPGGKRSLLVAFSIGQKGYLAGGWSTSPSSPHDDLWEYDPVSDTWLGKGSLPHSPGISCTVFVIGNKAYIHYPDQQFWEWDQGTGQWTRKADFPTGFRKGNISFSIGSKGYIGGGDDETSTLTDFWEWDQMTDTWIQKATLPYQMYGAASFSAGGKGYARLHCCYPSPGQFFTYDPSMDSWATVAPYPSLLSGRNTMYFSNGTKGYVGGTQWYNEFWEFDPQEMVGVAAVAENKELSIYPNPSSGIIHINSEGKKPVTLCIKDLLGNKIYEDPLWLFDGRSSIDLSLYPKGVYFVELQCVNERMIRKIVLE